MHLRSVVALTVALTCAPRVAAAAAGSTLYFDHDSATLLEKGEQLGAAIYVPSDVDTPTALPLVVFLHGTNPTGALHLWLGGGPAPDLRDVVDGWTDPGRPAAFLLAAPSQTHGAGSGSTLWPTFDLASFVDHAEAALPTTVEVDRQRILVVGHSGAGCNGLGGLVSIATTAASATTTAPYALVALDTCLDDPFAMALRKASTRGVSVSVFFQRTIWPRDFDGFVKATSPAVATFELAVAGSNAHDDIVALALRRFLVESLGPRSP